MALPPLLLQPVAPAGATAAPLPAAAAPTSAPAGPAATSFGEVLRDAATSTMDSLRGAERASLAGLRGDVPAQQVVNAVLEAETTLRTVVNIRDRAIAAYNEVMRMAI
ncbi:flagellar hook-basal body complex protein FliE [Inquilinus sp. NPDC058860]|uniref:flagellar hook-basal body complex protein FliE n=1 Tax=Inquilinus sp. NPDC058860 TaxID=3346652 RepID=UPI00367DE4A1